jgi:hypothetical protein
MTNFFPASPAWGDSPTKPKGFSQADFLKTRNEGYLRKKGERKIYLLSGGTTMRKVLFIMTLLLALTACGTSETVSREEWQKMQQTLNAQATQLALLMATPTTTPTAMPTTTPTPTTTAPAGSNAASAQFPDISSPRFDEGQDDNSWVSGITHDIGVLPFQVGLIFGTDIEWAGHSFKGGCQLVVLEPGFYPGVKYAGRYEIYDLPRSDPDGWKKVLIQQRIEEQHQNYRCPLKNVGDVPSLKP